MRTDAKGTAYHNPPPALLPMRDDSLPAFMPAGSSDARSRAPCNWDARTEWGHQLAIPAEALAAQRRRRFRRRTLALIPSTISLAVLVERRCHEGRGVSSGYSPKRRHRLLKQHPQRPQPQSAHRRVACQSGPAEARRATPPRTAGARARAR
eukprot:scaffold151883_cov28-Tisochrysis_lutea.AAC.2